MDLNNKKFDKRPAFTPLEKATDGATVRGRGSLTGFTIIELLTVMSIIVILFGLLVPALNMVRMYGKTVKQQAQFHAIDAGLQMFNQDFTDYPPSDARDRNTTGVVLTGSNTYPGAMKLAEAMLGEDLLGFNPNSVFNLAGTNTSASIDPTQQTLYPTGINPTAPTPPQLTNLQSRKGPYVSADKVTVAALKDLYGAQGATAGNIVICDEYPRTLDASTGKRVGLPVLYFKANISNFGFPDSNTATLPTVDNDQGYIYNMMDNQLIIEYKAAWDSATYNPISTHGTGKQWFDWYTEIRNKNIGTARPYNQDTYILMSAGPDGLYGTKDDVFNFVVQ